MMASYTLPNGLAVVATGIDKRNLFLAITQPDGS
jgi:hypothetical protein